MSKKIATTELPPNPYKGINEDLTSRLNADISTTDMMKLKSISPRHGTLQTIINLYVRTIILELNDLGIHHYSEENLGVFRSLILRHTHSSLIGEVTKGDDSTGKVAVRESHTDSANKSTDTKGNAGTGKQRVSKKEKGA